MEQFTVRFTDQIRQLIDESLESGNPLLLAAVSADRRPILSYRGSAKVYEEGTIGFWVRKPQGGTLEAIKSSPRVALMYRSEAVPMLQFEGMARITADEAERDRIFTLSPEREQAADPERKGVAVLIRVTSISGVMGFTNGEPQWLSLKSGE